MPKLWCSLSARNTQMSDLRCQSVSLSGLPYLQRDEQSSLAWCSQKGFRFTGESRAFGLPSRMLLEHLDTLHAAPAAELWRKYGRRTGPVQVLLIFFHPTIVLSILRILLSSFSCLRLRVLAHHEIRSLRPA